MSFATHSMVGRLAVAFVSLALWGCSEEQSETLAAGETFQDCEYCPEMIVVPSGSFMMGASDADDEAIDRLERPQKRITFSEKFAVGVTEVTVAQYRFCQLNGGCNASDRLYVLQLPDGRVINSRETSAFDEALLDVTYPEAGLNWLQAKAYTDWLSKHTGKSYRLLTEAEWEYVARAGSDTVYWWGDDFETGRAHCFACYENGLTFSEQEQIKVASFPPNPFGIYDLFGNVKEWVLDCRESEFAKKAFFYISDKRNGFCEGRGVRGGTFGNGYKPRASQRTFSKVDTVFKYYGFRVATEYLPERSN